MSNGKPYNALKLFKVKVSNIIGSVAILLSLYTQLSAQPFKLLSDKNVSDIVRELTIEEKAKILVGGYMESYTGQGAVSGHTMKMVQGAAGTTASLPSHGIFPVVMADGPAGLRIDPIREGDPETYYCTAFPIGTLLASTWDTEAVKLCGEAMGNEVREYGCDVLLGPGMNIQRHPLCGRNFEYYSEDPLISGICAAAETQGVQSHPGAGTTIKHFACNNLEDNRAYNNSHVTERTLREIYLKGFEIAIRKAQPLALMSSYNMLNGIHTANSVDLLTKAARQEWGFEGLIMTDWGTTAEPKPDLEGRMPLYGPSNAAACIKAGNDLLMPGSKEDVEEILASVDAEEGTVKYPITLEELRGCAERILRIIAKSNTYTEES